MAGTATTTVAGRQRGDGTVLLRRMSLGNAIALLIQFALGMIVNLYVSVPARDHGGGLLTAIGRALASGPLALTVHTVLGLLLLLGALNLVIRALLARQRTVAGLAVGYLLAVAGAAAGGAAFVDAGRDTASLVMALLTGVALLCLVLSLYLLRPGATRR